MSHREIGVYVLNKTMDNDLGGVDGEDGAPYTDFTSGFHTAVRVGVSNMLNHFNGAWTNNCPYLIGHFGRETNWVGIAMAYWGFADRFIYGELENGEMHSIDKIKNLIIESQVENERKYGRKFAMIVVPEGTNIEGIKHASDEIDPHGHPKLSPETLVNRLREKLDEDYGLKCNCVGITYEMRDFPPTPEDIIYGKDSAKVIADAILEGRTGVESVLKIYGDKVKPGIASIEKASKKRYAKYYEKNKKPFFNRETFRVTEEIHKYYLPLFGHRGELRNLLPSPLRKMSLEDIEE